MKTRAWHKQQGTLKPREETKEERLRRKKAKYKEKEQEAWNSGSNDNVNNTPSQSTKTDGGRKWLEDSADQLESGLIEFSELNRLRN